MPLSTIYEEPEVGEGLAERLTSGEFDKSKPSGRSKEVRPYNRHLPLRGFQRIRELGGYKPRETNYMKR